MPWSTITEDEVKTRFAGAELAALRQKALSAGQPDPLPSVIAEVIATVRGYVAACESNTLSAGATVPDNLKSTALDLVRHEMLNRLGLKVSEDRSAAWREAIRRLEKVAACAFAVDAPDEPIRETQSAGGISVVSKRDRLANRRTLTGLI